MGGLLRQLDGGELGTETMRMSPATVVSADGEVEQGEEVVEVLFSERQQSDDSWSIGGAYSSRRDTPTASGNPFILAPHLQDWDANGDRIASCQEYAGEKYDGFTRFEKNYPSMGTTAREIVDGAFYDEDVGLYTTSNVDGMRASRDRSGLVTVDGEGRPVLSGKIGQERLC